MSHSVNVKNNQELFMLAIIFWMKNIMKSEDSIKFGGAVAKVVESLGKLKLNKLCTISD